MNKKMLLVGHLQKFANPYISLYQEVGTGALFLLMCMTQTSEAVGELVESTVRECLMQQVSARVVLDYMEGSNNLKNIFRAFESHLCKLIPTTGDVYQQLDAVADPVSLIKVADVFNEDWCDEELNLSIFLEDQLNA